jgi:hypothetical protein
VAGTKRDRIQRAKEAAAPFLEERETVMRAAEGFRGPKTIYASLLGPIGYLLLERPRQVVLTGRRLLVLIPPARGARPSKLDVAVEREAVEVASYEEGRLWARLVLRTGNARPLPLNFARMWHDEAVFLRRKLEG